MTIKREQQLIKKGIDPDLYEISGSMKQYRIDMKNLIDTITAAESGTHPKRRVRRVNKRKTKSVKRKKS